MIDALPLLLGPEGYQISRSVRLRSSASATLTRTPSVDGNRKKWTWSGWVKRGSLGSSGYLMSCTSQSGNDGIAALYFSSDQLHIYYNTNTTNPSGAVGPAVYRDPSAWYHIVWAVDAANSIHYVYVNGVLVSTDTSKYPVNYDYAMNRAGYIQNMGTQAWGPTNYFDGYLTEVNFIDGQALTPSSFGETNPVTGVWQPKKYDGTYGTNGFYLNFSDNSAATAAAIGKDYSGNGNNWTPNNISVTAGATYDSMLDVPTQWADGGNGRGNYCVMNPLQGLSGFVCSDGNLKVAVSGTATGQRLSTISITSGKWYWENTYLVAPNGDGQYGVSLVDNPTLTVQLGTNAKGWSYSPFIGNIYNGSGTPITTVASASLNDVIGLALDADAGTLAIYKNNSLLYTFSSGVSGGALTPAIGGSSSVAFATAVNFGQRPFSYTPPTGFKALNTLNLPQPTILKGNQYFDATLWTGNQAARTITNSGEFQPDLIWTKSRSDAESHRLHDAVRGGNGSVLYELNSNETAAEGTDTLVSGFASNGFTIASGTNSPNITGRTYVGWQWKEGATQGFDIVTYTGTGSTQNINHSLGVAPRMMIVKKRSTTGNWPVYHASLGNATSPFLNLTNAANSQPNLWNSTTPTSSVFTVGSDGETNANTATFVAYLFSEVAGFSKFGSYTGNASADGPFVFCGFRPRYVLFKRTDSATGGDWSIYDSSRNTYNACNTELYPANSSGDETAGGASMDLLSNGFKIRNSRPGINASGGTYIFAAFAENPFKNALAR